MDCQMARFGGRDGRRTVDIPHFTQEKSKQCLWFSCQPWMNIPGTYLEWIGMVMLFGYLASRVAAEAWKMMFLLGYPSSNGKPKRPRWEVVCLSSNWRPSSATWAFLSSVKRVFLGSLPCKRKQIIGGLSSTYPHYCINPMSAKK